MLLLLLLLLLVIDRIGLTRRRRIGCRTTRRSSKRRPFLGWRVLTRRRRRGRRLVRATLRIDYAAQVHLFGPGGGGSGGGGSSSRSTEKGDRSRHEQQKNNQNQASSTQTVNQALGSATTGQHNALDALRVGGLTETALRPGKDEAIPERGSPVTCAAPARRCGRCGFNLTSGPRNVRCLLDRLYTRRV